MQPSRVDRCAPAIDSFLPFEREDDSSISDADHHNASQPFCDFDGSLDSPGERQPDSDSLFNNVHPTDGLSYAVSIDGAAPTIVNVTTATGANDTTMNRQWETNTSNNVNKTATTFTVDQPGVHTVKLWMVDPTVILQKLVVDTGTMAPSYLGPPESRQLH